MPQLTKVDYVGKHGYHKFRGPDGKFYCVPCTKEDVDNVFLNPPTRDGMVWFSSSILNKYDTPSGFLENGQYAEVDGEPHDFFCFQDVDFLVPKGSIVDGILTKEAEDFLNEKDQLYVAIKKGDISHAGTEIFKEIWL